MRPATYTDAALLKEKRPILLIDVDAYRLGCNRWRVDAVSSGRLTTKERRRRLPAELWRMISKYRLDEPMDLYATEHWVAARPVEVAIFEVDPKAVVKCVEVDPRPSSKFETAGAALDFEAFLADPSHDGPYSAIVKPHARRFEITLRLGEEWNPHQALPHQGLPRDAELRRYGLDDPEKRPCLYLDIDVPDWISRLENGACQLCAQKRWICPSCRPQLCTDFGVPLPFETHLACPRCLGVTFSRQDRDFSIQYSREVLERDMEALVKWRRMKRIYSRTWHLGYEWLGDGIVKRRM